LIHKADSRIRTILFFFNNKMLPVKVLQRDLLKIFIALLQSRPFDMLGARIFPDVHNVPYSKEDGGPKPRIQTAQRRSRDRLILNEKLSLKDLQVVGALDVSHREGE